MQGVVDVGYVLVAAVDRECVLSQVVGADAEEVALARERVGGDRSRRNFDHQTEGNVLVVGDSGPLQVVEHLRDQHLCTSEFVDGGDHRQH
jgi:hypothetical protein